MVTKQKPNTFVHPRYWPTWIGLAMLRLVTLLPYRIQIRLGQALGACLYYIMKKRRHIAEVNIGLCFPHLDKTAKQHLVKSTIISVNISLFETALSWWGSPRTLSPLSHIDGIENLQSALEKGKGVILLSAHFTCLEIGGRLLSFQQPFAVMYKRHRNALFEHIMTRARENHYQHAIQRHDVRGMIRALKQNLVCWYAPDQDFGRKQSIFVPFLGVDAATITAPARIAKITGAAVVPFFPKRRNDGKGYQLTISPALSNFPTGDENRDAAYINQIIGEQVLLAPDQYLWLHRRFKTRPEGHATLYGFADKRPRQQHLKQHQKKP